MKTVFLILPSVALGSLAVDAVQGNADALMVVLKAIIISASLIYM